MDFFFLGGGTRSQRCCLAAWLAGYVCFRPCDSVLRLESGPFFRYLSDQIRGRGARFWRGWFGFLLRLSKLSALQFSARKCAQSSTIHRCAQPTTTTTTTATILLQGMLIHNPLRSNKCNCCGVLLSRHSYATIASCRRAAWLTGSSSSDLKPSPRAAQQPKSSSHLKPLYKYLKENHCPPCYVCRRLSRLAVRTATTERQTLH